MNKVDVESLLPLVEKPSRYINHEINAIHKGFADSSLHFVFAFPDAYELGVSHLGIKILYSIINSLPGCMADRAYLPWVDLADLMRQRQYPLFAWESRMPLKAFDLIGITLQSELTYSNVLEFLDLCGLELRSGKRSESDPIIMAGGPCATNPLPLAPFIDVFFLGEAEEGIIEIADILKAHSDKHTRLQRLAELRSCYVPALWSEAKTIVSRKFADFHKSALQHSPQLLSWQLATHNRYVAEIMRGCSRGCRFCHAGYFYRPVRERKPRDIMQNLLKEIKSSGWDEAGLVSLSSSDYSCIQELLLNLLNKVNTSKTHISLPSLRVDSLNDELLGALQSLGREGLTIAPEAGSERLRKVINKNLSEMEIMAGIRIALGLGWQKIKLYFMLGLPTENEADIDAIIALIDQINQTGKRRLQINVTLSPFVPKPFTPFQWCAMADKETLLERARRIKNSFSRARNIKIKYHTIENSILEAALTRGDLEMAEVLEAAWKNGARFDGWNELFDFEAWTKASEQTGVQLSRYLQAMDLDCDLPWDFIDTGVTQAFLKNEYQQALQEVQTPDCRLECSVCGACRDGISTQDAVPDQDSKPIEKKAVEPRQLILHVAQYRYRVFYQKMGLLRFISHLDWMRMLFRRIAILDLETVFTQGFSPHPKVSLAPPLPVGVEGLAEYFDVSFYQSYTPEEILSALGQTRIPDFNLIGCERIAGKAILPEMELLSVGIKPEFAAQFNARIMAFRAKDNFSYTKSTETRSKTYDLKRIISSIDMQDNELKLVKKLESPSLYDVLGAILEVDKELLYTLPVRRTGFA
jgi:radical SAM family uncharacterized protein/radical SAM-linked protein